jgi:hypothetical protein
LWQNVLALEAFMTTKASIQGVAFWAVASADFFAAVAEGYDRKLQIFETVGSPTELRMACS